MTSRLPSAGKAAPAHGAAAARDPRLRMQVAGDFAIARLRRRFVTERQRAERQGLGKPAADIVGRIGIVIAGDPQPVAAALQRFEPGAADVAHARRSAAVMKTVAQRDDADAAHSAR